MRRFTRSLLAQPRVPDPPVRVWRDWALVAVLVLVAIIEATLRDDVLWSPLALGMAIGLIVALLWRRTHPLAVVAIVFGSIAAVGLATVAVGAGEFGLYVWVVIAIFPYSLFRWASGRDAAVGMMIIMATAVIGGVVAAINDTATNPILETLMGAAIFFVLPAVVGALVRVEVKDRSSEIDKAKLRERELLARELHDTVAHHVSAIVIQAQAGSTVAATNPEAATDALELIEAEAKRTLAEMRLMVGALRDDEGAELSPQRGVADIEQLARNSGDVPSIHVEVSGDLSSLTPAVDTAIYRIAQESVTNAVKHANQATRIDVSVRTDDDHVVLTVSDDGESVSSLRDLSGYGLVGMSERTAILGGTLDAGPTEGRRGWTVSAVLPTIEGPT